MLWLIAIHMLHERSLSDWQSSIEYLVIFNLMLKFFYQKSWNVCFVPISRFLWSLNLVVLTKLYLFYEVSKACMSFWHGGTHLTLSETKLVFPCGMLTACLEKKLPILVSKLFSQHIPSSVWSKWNHQFIPYCPITRVSSVVCDREKILRLINTEKACLYIKNSLLKK